VDSYDPEIQYVTSLTGVPNQMPIRRIAGDGPPATRSIYLAGRIRFLVTTPSVRGNHREMQTGAPK